MSSPQKVLVTGGVRSGKSRHAEALLADLAEVTYVAPGQVPDPARDPEWAVASDIPVMRENLGEYAIYVPPTDAAAIAAAMEGSDRDDGLSDVRVAYSTERFSWSRVVNVIRRVLVEASAAVQ